MHDNQLLKIAELVNKTDIQFVASILREKLSEELNKEELFVVKLSQSDKLSESNNNTMREITTDHETCVSLQKQNSLNLF